MVTIQCQRLNAAGLYEEIDIEVPAGVYNNIQTVNYLLLLLLLLLLFLLLG